MRVNRTDTLNSLVSSVHRLTRIAAQSTGSSISSAVWPTLSVLRTDGPHRIGDLAKAVRVSQPGMTKIVQGLVEDEWVYRIADVDDSRAWLIAVTPKGTTALDAWKTQLAETLAPVFDELSESDWDALSRASRILATRVAGAEVAA